MVAITVFDNATTDVITAGITATSVTIINIATTTGPITNRMTTDILLPTNMATSDPSTIESITCKCVSK